MAETTFTIKCAAIANDADESAEGSVNNNNSFVRMGPDFPYNALRMANCVVDQGAYIVSATLKLYLHNVDYPDLVFDAHFQAVNGAANAPTTSYGISNLPRTTAKASISILDAWNGNLWVDVPGLASGLQEVVSRPGFVNGNAVMPILVATGAVGQEVRYRSRDYSSTYSAQLEITWDTEWPPVVGDGYRPITLNPVGAVGQLNKTIGV